VVLLDHHLDRIVDALAGVTQRGRHACVLDEVLEERGAGGVGLGRADPSLHGSELAIQDPGTRQFFHVLQQPWPEAGERVQLIGDELLAGGIEALRAHELGVLQAAREPEVVGAARRDRDADAGASTSSIDVIDDPAGTR
jgi:hypothetical protein